MMESEGKHPADGRDSAGTRAVPELATARLRLRAWRESDRDAFAALNADPLVMEHYPRPLTRQESDEGLDRIVAHFEKYGYGLWAVEVPGEASFAGFVGLNVPRFEAPFTPCVELGWRLAHALWGRGYAVEAAHAAIAHGFSTVGLAELLAFTTPRNTRSRRVMEKLGMHHDPADDFEHPLIPEGHALRRHVLYRLSREEWGP